MNSLDYIIGSRFPVRGQPTLSEPKEKREYKFVRLAQRITARIQWCPSEYPYPHPIWDEESDQDPIISKLCGRVTGSIRWSERGGDLYFNTSSQMALDKIGFDLRWAEPIYATDHLATAQTSESVRRLTAPFLDLYDKQKSGYSIVEQCPLCFCRSVFKARPGIFLIEKEISTHVFKLPEYPSLIFFSKSLADAFIDLSLTPIYLFLPEHFGGEFSD